MASDRGKAEADRLDDEIAALKDEIAAAQRQLKIETSTIASSEAGKKLIKAAESQSHGSSDAHTLTAAQRHEAHIQQSFYRISTPVTTFKVRDPDPNAVDDGHVIAIRFEAMSRGQFLNPYYVMLNRPYPNSTHLRVHRHTLPPAIPLSGLAARHLPPPKQDEGDTASSQDLDHFVRSIRREVTRYHNRLGVSADLRRALGLHRERQGNLRPNDVIDVGIADIEAKQVRITWADERSGRLVMDDDGKVIKFAVYGGQDRDWDTTIDLIGLDGRIEDAVEQLRDYAAG